MPHFHDTSLGAVADRLRRARARRREPAVTLSEEETFDPGEAPDEVRTTLDATIRPTAEGSYRRLRWAPGEPHLVRSDLGIDARPGREQRRRSLIYFAQHTDTHICDAQSPARLEGGIGFGWAHPGADSGQRPQETCTTQVFDHLIQATNALATSPLSGAPMVWCIQTGDNTDNRTDAELHWWLDVLAGRTVHPNTGDPEHYEGAQRSNWAEVWQPDRPGWDLRQRRGFPHLPGFLDGAIGPFDSTGLQVPWLAVFGNHDQIFQGSFGPNRGPRIDRLEALLAGGDRKAMSTFGMVRAIVHASTFGTGRGPWQRLGRGLGIERVTPDPEARRAVPLDEYLARLVSDEETGTGPRGHGFTEANVEDGTSWWSRVENDRVAVIGLDSCHHRDGDAGRLGPTQTRWLTEELRRHHSRYQAEDGEWVDGDGTDRLVIIASHHNSWTMDNRGDDDFDPGPPTTGDDLVALFDRFPNVVLWVNGHSHEHKVVPHRRTGTADGDGWWELNTASAIDFGQQGRIVELFDNDDGTLSIVATVIDHAAAPQVRYHDPAGWTPARLASLSRELAVNDDQWIDPVLLINGPEDRNVELLVAVPAGHRPR